MKRLSILLALWVCATTNAVAQYPYTHRIDAVANDMTFSVMRAGNVFMTLDNITNELGDQKIVWIDGTPLTEKEYNLLEIGEIDVNGFYKAIRETFSEEEYKVLEDGKDRIEVALVVSPNGEILEVGWSIYVTPRTDAITPDQFALFEQNIKKYVTYTVTEDMKRVRFFRTIHNLNFGMLGVSYFKAELNPGDRSDSLQTHE